MIERRQYPRLNANVLWRSAGLRGPHRPPRDMSLGGVRVYSDDLVPVGERVELELLVPGEEPVVVLARVVRVGILPASEPAFCDVALEFLAASDDDRGRITRLLGAAPSESEAGLTRR